MPTSKEVVFLCGVLRGEGRLRQCRVKATKHSTYVDESSEPASVAYSSLSIEDADDYPDGNYELEFNDHKAVLSKINGFYLTT